MYSRLTTLYVRQAKGKSPPSDTASAFLRSDAKRSIQYTTLYRTVVSQYYVVRPGNATKGEDLVRDFSTMGGPWALMYRKTCATNTACEFEMTDAHLHGQPDDPMCTWVVATARPRPGARGLKALT